MRKEADSVPLSLRDDYSLLLGSPDLALISCFLLLLLLRCWLCCGAGSLSADLSYEK